MNNLEKETFYANFNSESDMMQFLKAVDQSDIRIEVPVCETKTSISNNGLMLVSTPEDDYLHWNREVGIPL